MKKTLSFNLLNLFLILFAAIAVTSCSGKSVDDGNAQEVYKDAEEDISDKRYTIALDKLKVLKNKFPYSNIATQAKLRIADVYFLEESYIEASAAYEGFRDMHPRNEKADYVLFRIGESYFFQLPDSDDRDMGPAAKAIEAYRELVQLYPKSQYVDAAKKHLSQATEMQASKEKYIADFYYARDMYDSAASRYEKITSKFPDTSLEQYAYWRLAQSLIRQQKLDEAKHVFRTYLSRHPSGEYASKAGDWLDEAGGR